ncbi:Holliday junction DNA helicase subunit RuvA [Longilinea arvoryzae]|uniref:Holliday junction branch migration complex subunit RuvA n=1 Tax=Longilinea arvoryzae TaxID=360412 RepID=A0A0S7BIX0_9CHLR|nr:Holliday junction branch migration protein RuvA [Longilinea arvoryzae]GAP14531.1 Holliday junction DNA helicase subunit RuvA [Longilinea arvoryzae]
MIASIQGEVLSQGNDNLVILVGGIGLRVFAPTATCSAARPGQYTFLQTHLVVREDALTLYGFETEMERNYFSLLLGVNGVGPRIALAILSVLSVDSIRRAVLSEQADVFSRVPGVGKKTAQKILLHMQGKVGPEGVLAEAAGLMDVDAEVLDGLTGLGYSVVEAQAAIQSIPRDATKDVEERLRLALQFFMK